jgi:hypothetical protein
MRRAAVQLAIGQLSPRLSSVGVALVARRRDANNRRGSVPAMTPMPERPAVRWPITIASCVILLLAGALGMAPLIPPETPSDGAGGFSTTRAYQLIERLAREPHAIGTLAIERVRATIVDELRLLGLEPELQVIETPDYFGGSSASVNVVNVVVRIPGSASTGAVAVVGHYDTVPTTPGANDDTSAVAILLEGARALLAGPRERNDVILLFTDGEEPAPRYGSSAFVTGHRWAGEIGVVINLEAVGCTGPSTLIATSGSERWLIDQYVEAAPDPMAYSYLTAITRLLGGSNSDFSVFRDRGVPGFELAYLHGSPIYHSPADTPDRVDRRSLHQQGANALALTRHLAGLDLGAAHDSGEAIFLTLGRSVVVRYPVELALPVALLAGLSLAAAGWRRRKAATRSIRWGLAGSGLVVIISALAGAGIWTLVATARSTMGLVESYAYLAALVAMTIGIAVCTGWLLRRRGDPDPVAVTSIWLALALLTGATAPGFSYLFGWPTLAASVVLLSSARRAHGARPWLEFGGFTLMAATVVVLLVPPIDTLYQLAQPRPGNPDSEVLALVAVPVALIALVVELIRAHWVRDGDVARAQSPATGG